MTGECQGPTRGGKKKVLQQMENSGGGIDFAKHGSNKEGGPAAVPFILTFDRLEADQLHQRGKEGFPTKSHIH